MSTTEAVAIVHQLLKEDADRSNTRAGTITTREREALVKLCTVSTWATMARRA